MEKPCSQTYIQKRVSYLLFFLFLSTEYEATQKGKDMSKKKVAKKTKAIPKAQALETKIANQKKANWQLWVALAAVALIVFVVYRPSLKNDWTNWDDPTYVTENLKVKNFDWETVKYFFDTDNPVSLNYHPLTMLSLAWDYSIADSKGKKSKENLYPGYDAKQYHRTNLILHILNCLLVFLFVYILTRKKLLPALIVAILFGVHPMHVESVAWISERKDVMYAFFFLSALIFYLKYLKELKIYHLAVAFVLFLCSLLSERSCSSSTRCVLCYRFLPRTKILLAVSY